MSTVVEVPKIEAAVDQLDWSVRLFLDHSAYVPAITLAGASDTLLEKCIGLAEKGQTAQTTIRGALQDAGYGTEKHIGAAMNAARNYLKHGFEPIDFNSNEMDLQSEAIQQILRAMINLARLENCLPSEGPRFLDWLHANRPDLTTRHSD